MRYPNRYPRSTRTTDRLRPVRTAHRFGFEIQNKDTTPPLRGDLFLILEHEGQVTKWERRNLIVLDAGILIMRLLVDPTEPLHGLNMLAIGTGAPGDPNNPDAPTVYQRSLNNEIARKNLTTQFRFSDGSAASVPTSICDFTVQFGPGEAVGSLNEMALLSTISSNQSTGSAVPAPNTDPYDPELDISDYDNMFNVLNFPVVNKPSGATLTLTWRITV